VVSLLPAILLVFVLASLFKIAFIYHVLYVLVAVALLARAWASQTAGRLSFRRDLEPRALWGETLAMRVELRNGGPLPIPWLRLRDRVPVELGAPAVVERAISLGPGQVASYQIDLQCRQRGWYALGPFSVDTGDVLGLNLMRREFATAQRLLVYPRILPLPTLGLPSRTPFGDVRTQQPLYEDPSRVMGVRDYQPGDSQRLIHWRTSAALGRLQVKKLEPAMTLQTVVVLDLDPGAYERGATHYATELAITVAASLANHLVGLRQEVGLLTNGHDPGVGGEAEGGRLYLAARKGRAQLTRILDTLARVQTRSGDPLGSMLATTMGGLSWGSTVVVVCGQETDELTGALTRLRRAGFAVALVLVSQRSPYAQGGGAAALGVPVHNVWRESDLDGGDPGPRRRAVQLSRTT
jgi:uncharacterized protein (DUF58 family)